MSDPPFIAAAREAIPGELLPRSGKVFYSGKNAFSAPAPLYVLGVNPGGDPDAPEEETVAAHTAWVATAAPSDWSAYRDESWKGKRPGTHGMQPRLLHMFKVLGLSPGSVPASNLLFVRSRREGDLAQDIEHFASLCWPFHHCVIANLRPRVILCLGQTAGEYVRGKVGAHERYATFTEQNARKWQSHAYRSHGGLKVVVATHPSIANWSAAPSDPTSLLASALRDA
jgi:uracil-DNA glycosylase family 4